MNRRSFACLLLTAASSLSTLTPAFCAEIPAGLATVKTKSDLDAVISATTDAGLKQALQSHSAALLAAAEQRTHVEAVLRAVEISPGKVEKINTTPESLKKATGGDIGLFDTLKLVDLAMPNSGPHDHRKVDPYDAAFFAHLGHIQTLESLNIIATKLSDEWIAPLGKLTNLKTLRFTNNGKLSDVGLEHLAGLKNLEQFSFVGTGTSASVALTSMTVPRPFSAKLTLAVALSTGALSLTPVTVTATAWLVVRVPSLAVTCRL